MTMKPREFRYITSARGWTRELLLMFVVGLVLATMFWLGLWFFHVQPVQAAALQAQKTALQDCLAGEKLCDEVKDKLEAENKESSRRLDEALAAWGRCIRARSRPEN